MTTMSAGLPQWPGEERAESQWGVTGKEAPSLTWEESERWSQGHKEGPAGSGEMDQSKFGVQTRAGVFSRLRGGGA